VFTSEKMFQWFSENSISFLNIEFYGVGDEGSIERLMGSKIDGCAFEIVPHEHLHPGRDMICVDIDFYQQICFFFEDILCEQYPGWEINDGSSGTMLLDVNRRTLKFSTVFNIVTQDYQESEISLTENVDG
jgi:hypothetical protein